MPERNTRWSHARAPDLNPWREQDACGVGFVARASGERSHEVAQLALEALKRVAHRGAAMGDALQRLEGQLRDFMGALPRRARDEPDATGVLLAPRIAIRGAGVAPARVPFWHCASSNGSGRSGKKKARSCERAAVSWIVYTLRRPPAPIDGSRIQIGDGVRRTAHHRFMTTQRDSPGHTKYSRRGINILACSNRSRGA